MHFDAAKLPAGDRLSDYLLNAPFVSLGMDKGKPNQAIGFTGNNLRCVSIRLLV